MTSDPRLTRAEVANWREHAPDSPYVRDLADTALALMDDLTNREELVLATDAALCTAEARIQTLDGEANAYKAAHLAAEARAENLQRALERTTPEAINAAERRIAALEVIVRRTAGMGDCSQAHHWYLSKDARALLSEPQDGEGGAPDDKITFDCSNCGHANTFSVRVTASLPDGRIGRPTPPASPRCADGYCDVPEHWEYGSHYEPCSICGSNGHETPQHPTSPPASPCERCGGCGCAIIHKGNSHGFEMTHSGECPKCRPTSPPAEPTPAKAKKGRTHSPLECGDPRHYLIFPRKRRPSPAPAEGGR